jgi:hypothetical protein
VLVRTPRARNTLAATYPALLAATGGKYRFALRNTLAATYPALVAATGGKYRFALRNTLAATYPALLAATGGKYRFALRYKLVNGEAGLGASIGDGSPWLTLSTAGHQADHDREVDFWVDLKSGQEVHLKMMNGAEGPPATFLMKTVTAVAVLDSTGTGERPPQ